MNFGSALRALGLYGATRRAGIQPFRHLLAVTRITRIVQVMSDTPSTLVYNWQQM